MLDHTTIAFLGAGSMAEAMISGIVNKGVVPNQKIFATNRKNKERLKELEMNYGIKGIHQENIPFDQIDIFVLAMKPKDVGNALSSLKNSIKPNQLILSVLAGVTTSFIEAQLHEGQQVVRVMPNTSSMVGESATAISPGTYTTAKNVHISERLLQSIGEVYTIEESKMDIFTGLAGSGPAYFYYLMEHMEQAGFKAGLDEKTTRSIIAQTVMGAAKMVLEKEEKPEELRIKVTSPNGTTAAGLDALNQNGGGYAIAQAVLSAAKRSSEISEQFETSEHEDVKEEVVNK
ncbi:pyrroline-5-carboxylate reductase [Bacillus dakarensis]|uniref:pyrroline-5-carboxylate reductase n=1 Tax=Robertmurraya dakarensis TaxID=1926278 RepID=UPI0009818FEA|nr:pyrroline-5-carboxylate reductase [Bacillus dakarensis]